MEIYKEQQQLREALEKELNKQGIGGNGQSTLDQMKQIEKQLLNKGFNNENLQKILNVKYELLKLEKAVQQQGEDKKRQSETNKKEFNNQANALPARLQEYLNSIEILNRQSLPLRSISTRRFKNTLKPMISFNYELDFKLENETIYSDWISKVISSENRDEGEINYIFCDDDYLIELNQQYLDHDTLTDVISFDYSEGNELHGDVFISIERVRENASILRLLLMKN